MVGFELVTLTSKTAHHITDAARALAGYCFNGTASSKISSGNFPQYVDPEVLEFLLMRIFPFAWDLGLLTSSIVRETAER